MDDDDGLDEQYTRGGNGDDIDEEQLNDQMQQ